MQDGIDMLKEKIEQADEYHSAYSLFFFLSFGSLVLLGLCSWVFSCGSCSMAMAVPAGFLMLMLSWLLIGLFYAVAVSLDDTCVELSRQTTPNCLLSLHASCFSLCISMSFTTALPLAPRLVSLSLCLSLSCDLSHQS